MPATSLSIAMISVHSSPVGKLGTQDTGGMSVYIRELSCRFGLGGHAVDIFTLDSDDHRPGDVIKLAPNVRLIAVEPGWAPNVPKNELYRHLPGFFRRMDRFRQTERTTYDLLHSHYWLSGRVGWLAQRQWGIPHATTFHTLGAVKNILCGEGSEPARRIAAERDLVAVCDGLIVTSASERENLIRHYDAAPHRTALVPCGVDLDLFRPRDRELARQRINAQRDEKLLLYVGRFAREKGLERLIRAVAQLRHIPNLRLLVVGGDGGEDAACRRMVEFSRSCGMADRISFHGRREQSELPWYYSAADLLVLPSSYESFGMVALEALSCGTPVAATRVGAMEELLADGRNGRLARDLTPASLAAAIADLAQCGVASPFRSKSIRRSVLRYGWSQVASEVLRVYHTLLPDAAAGGPAAGRLAPAPKTAGCGQLCSA